jgi:hypothetical protein
MSPNGDEDDTSTSGASNTAVSAQGRTRCKRDGRADEASGWCVLFVI